MNTRSTQRPSVKVVTAEAVRKVRRTFRRPPHRFNLKAKPYEICPFMIAPVLPGETLVNALFQVRAVSDPIQNALIGWHKEYYWFYVPLPALSDWDTGGLLKNMMIDTTTDVSTLKAAANSVPYYTFKTGMDYVLKCTEAVVKQFFRDEDEAVNVASIENYFAAQIDQETWAHSLKKESAGTDDKELPGVDEQEELDILTGMSTIYDQWELMRDVFTEDVTFEDFCRSYGVNIPKSEDQGESPDAMYQPELIRFIRDWTYPSNTVNATDGTVASAVSWSLKEKITKKRFFKYPGFIFGVTVTRPKLYLGSQKGAAVGMFNGNLPWLPAVYQTLPYTSVIEQLDSATDGILQNQTEDYWLDARDVFRYGDQFVNHAMSAAANHGIALPTAALDKKYPTDAMIESLFKTANVDYVREDGVCNLNILGRLGPDTTG